MIRRLAYATFGSVVLAAVVVSIADRRAEDRRRAVARHAASIAVTPGAVLTIRVGDKALPNRVSSFTSGGAGGGRSYGGGAT